jgi:hypothetical protein
VRATAASATHSFVSSHSVSAVVLAVCALHHGARNISPAHRFDARDSAWLSPSQSEQGEPPSPVVGRNPSPSQSGQGERGGKAGAKRGQSGGKAGGIGGRGIVVSWQQPVRPNARLTATDGATHTQRRFLGFACCENLCLRKGHRQVRVVIKPVKPRAAPSGSSHSPCPNRLCCRSFCSSAPCSR